MREREAFTMTDEEKLFFAGCPEALALYEPFRARVLAAVPDAHIRVQKTQITFADRHGFAFVSRLAVRRKAERPPVWITVSFGLRRRLPSPRVDGAVEPYPERWTHHVMIGDPSEIDGELMDWIGEAAAFAAMK